MYDLSGICGGGNLYVVYIELTGCTTWDANGTLANQPNGARYLQVTSTSCNSSLSGVQAYTNSWPSNADGNYVSFETGSAVYTNNGCSAPIIMPVETKYLNVYKKGKTIELVWATASETNNDFFTIERSADGSTYEAIGTIKGAGNSSREISYEFTDKAPLKGLNYYRIKQTDFDGKYSYSEVRSVRFTDASTITVSPRTTEGRIHVTTDMENYEVTVITASGASVRTLNGLSADQSISIEDLQPGIYFIRVSGGTHSETVRVIKL